MADATETPVVETSQVVAPPIDAAPDEPIETPSQSADGRVEPPHPLEERRLERKPARKDRATPKDVPTIQALSGVIRELTAKDDADAPRVAELRKKLRAALELDSPAATSQASPRPLPAMPAAPSLPGDFTETEPNIDQFANEADPYAAYVRALARYDRRKEAHESERTTAQRSMEQTQQASLHQWNQTLKAHADRIEAAKSTKYKDWDSVVTGASTTPFLNEVIAMMPNGDDVIYSLAKDKNALDEITLLSMSLPVTNDTVALLQRRLNARLTAGTTGAAPTKPVLVAPRPPTPVRTGVMQTGETPPSDDADLDAHRAAYGVGARRRR